MRVKDILDEDFVNYSKPSMFIACISCDWKCCKEINQDICLCQNSPIAKSKNIYVDNEKLINRYLNNKITKSIVIAGLEPFLQFDEIIDFIELLRKKTKDEVVIYTGYRKEEILNQINDLKKYENIIVKFGRFKPNQKSHLDKILGVNLANEEQYAEKIS